MSVYKDRLYYFDVPFELFSVSRAQFAWGAVALKIYICAGLSWRRRRDCSTYPMEKNLAVIASKMTLSSWIMSIS